MLNPYNRAVNVNRMFPNRRKEPRRETRTYLQVYVNYKHRHDISKENKLLKILDTENYRLQHYGDGVDIGDKISIYNMSPYFQLFLGFVGEDGVLTPMKKE